MIGRLASIGRGSFSYSLGFELMKRARNYAAGVGGGLDVSIGILAAKLYVITEWGDYLYILWGV